MGWLPPGMDILTSLRESFGDYMFLLITLIIFLESIVYVGFYFPGQFFAVVLVILSKPQPLDILMLTVAMVAAATLGSVVNYLLGSRVPHPESDGQRAPVKHLLLAMIHMNSLAFFMFNQGANGRPMSVVWLAGLLNLPYYLVLIAATVYLSEDIMQVAENNWLLFSLISIWLGIALVLDVRKHRREKLATVSS